MWLARQMRSAPPTADADMGVTTIAGDRVGVLTRGEVRELPVWSRRLCLAAGKWRGGAGDQGRPWRRGTVCGRDGAERSAQGHAAGRDLSPWPRRQLCPPHHFPAGRQSCRRGHGVVDIRGRLMINGIPYTPCQCGMEA